MSEGIIFTDAAVEAVKKELSTFKVPNSLRLSVVGGGCSGYQYQMEPDTEERETDTVLIFGDLNVIVDSVSFQYLEGTTVDFVSGLNKTGFVFKNPNKRTCGCGNSFS